MTNLPPGDCLSGEELACYVPLSTPLLQLFGSRGLKCLESTRRHKHRQVGGLELDASTGLNLRAQPARQVCHGSHTPDVAGSPMLLHGHLEILIRSTKINAVQKFNSHA